MNSTYQSNIQLFQGCYFQSGGDHGLTPMVIQIVPLRGTTCIENNLSVKLTI